MRWVSCRSISSSCSIRQAIVTNMHRAYQHPGLFTARYSVFMTGPSATADIEGVLIHGAQGIRTMSVIPCRRGARVPPQPDRCVDNEPDPEGPYAGL